MGRKFLRYFKFSRVLTDTGEDLKLFVEKFCVFNPPKARNDEDYDEEAEEDLQIEDEEDSFVLQKVSDVIHQSFGLNKQSLLPYFSEYLKEPCIDLIKPKRAWSDRQWGKFIRRKYTPCF